MRFEIATIMKDLTQATIDFLTTKPTSKPIVKLTSHYLYPTNDLLIIDFLCPDKTSSQLVTAV